MPALSPERQRKAQRKIAINGAVVMVMYLLSTVLASLPNETQTLTAVPTAANFNLWIAQLPLFAAILGTIAAFTWPFYLVVRQEHETA